MEEVGVALRDLFSLDACLLGVRWVPVCAGHGALVEYGC